MRRIFAAAVVCAAFVPAAPAAALEFRPCAGTPDYECAKLAVPLDPASPGGPALSLEVRRLVETRDGRGVLIALAGGPGQGATDFIDTFAEVLAEGLEDHQLIVLDQRGTGQSGALTCPALASGAESLSFAALTRQVGQCAVELGPTRRLYTTTEVVSDLEALRAALGTERVSVYGVSYGAYVAQRYARAFPGHVERLVLDSPVAQDQGGPFDASSYSAAARVLRGRCGADLCDVARLVRRLPLRGTAFDAHGRRHTVRVHTAGELFDLLVASDFSPALRAALPAAFRAAARGDAAPLARLAQGDTGPPDPPSEFSDALYFTTTCEEKPRPAGAVPDSPFGPIQSTQVGSAFCSEWPATPVAAPPAPAKLDAQALVLSGSEDLRTPWEEARRTAQGIRDGTLVRVPGAGHAVLSQARPCVSVALARFFAGQSVGNPCDGAPAARVPSTPAAPRSLRGRTAVALATVADAVRTAAIPGPLSEPYGAGGLRGGSFCAHPGELTAGRRPLLLTLRRDEYVPGMPVTGSATVSSGRLVALDVRVAGHGRVHGLRAAMPALTVPATPDRVGNC